MAKKQWTDEERKAFGEKMKAARQNKETKDVPTEVAQQPVEQPEQQVEQQPVQEPTPSEVEEIAPEQGLNELKAQIKEVIETNALLKAAFLGNQDGQSIGVDKSGSLVGEVDKYLVDPEAYPDPTKRLAAEPKLVAALNFPFNYELEYTVGVSSYENRAGVNMREPKFQIGLYRIVIDDQGNQTDKRYVARRLVFHEDPQAALVIARENGVPVNKDNEKAFLDEMRYLRCRDWLFDIFWPKPASLGEKIQEEVINGTMVQVFTKSSLEPTGVDFEKIKNKITV